MTINDSRMSDISPDAFRDEIGRNKEIEKLVENFNCLNSVAIDRAVAGGSGTLPGHSHNTYVSNIDQYTGGPTIPLCEGAVMGYCLRPTTSAADDNGNGLFVAVAPAHYLMHVQSSIPDPYIFKRSSVPSVVSQQMDGRVLALNVKASDIESGMYAFCSLTTDPDSFHVLSLRVDLTGGGPLDTDVLFLHTPPSSPTIGASVNLFGYKKTGEYWRCHTPEWASKMIVRLPLSATFEISSWESGKIEIVNQIGLPLFNVWIEHESGKRGEAVGISCSESSGHPQYQDLEFDLRLDEIERGVVNRWRIAAEINDSYFDLLFGPGSSESSVLRRSALLWHHKLAGSPMVPSVWIGHRAI